MNCLGEGVSTVDAASNEMHLQFEDDRGMNVGQSRQFCSFKEDTAGLPPRLI